MGKPQGNVIYRNLANAISILGVLPLVLLFLDDGYRYLIPLIIFNNVMDDLDGILAIRLNIRSRFGGDLDNVCDAVAHTILVLAVGAHFGELVLLGSVIAAASIILRVTIRVNPEGKAGTVRQPMNSCATCSSSSCWHKYLTLILDLFWF